MKSTEPINLFKFIVSQHQSSNFMKVELLCASFGNMNIH
jgi:hypothetical protein